MSARKLTSSHLRRAAFVYVRQSTQAQLERNVESTAAPVRAGRARDRAGVRARAGRGDRRGSRASPARALSERSGFARLTAEVALGHVGIVLGLEVSRLARNNADWYRLLDLCGVTDTVIGDADGIYHPGSFNDRLLLGLKGTMSEAELHVLRARLDGGIRNKAARGELRRGLPVGLVWGEADGEILLRSRRGGHAARSARSSTASPSWARSRAVWLWLRSRGLRSRCSRSPHGEIQWVPPSYHQSTACSTNPIYAGAYAYGKTRRERYVDEHGRPRQRIRRLPRRQNGRCLIWDHHPGFIDWATFEANQERIAAQHAPARARGRRRGPRGRGAAAGDRRLRALRAPAARPLPRPARQQTPGLPLPGSDPRRGPRQLVPARRRRADRRGRRRRAARRAAPRPASRPRCTRPRRWSQTTTRRSSSGGCRSSAPATRRSAPSGATAQSSPSTGSSPAASSATGSTRSARSPTAEAELALREQQRPRTLTDDEREQLLSARRRPRPRVVGADHHRPRPQAAAALPDRGGDPRRRARAAPRDAHHALARRRDHRAGRPAATPPTSRDPHRRGHDRAAPPARRPLRRRHDRRHPQPPRPPLRHRRALHRASSSAACAATASIPRHQPPAEPPDGELLTVAKAADELGVAASTLHRWLQDGFIAGEQDTPGAPWRIRVNDQLRARFVEDAPPG